MNTVVVTVGTSGSNWEMWTAIATVATVVMLFFAALFAGLQVKSARKSSDTQFVVGLYERFYNEETMQILRLVYQTKRENIENLPRDSRDKIYMMLNWFDVIGMLMRNGIVSEYMAVEVFGGSPVLRCWHVLGDFIRKERVRRGGYYAQGVEYFARCTVKYQIRNVSKDQWIRFYPGPCLDNDVVNLINEEIKEPHLLSECELSKALACRKLKSTYKKELRQGV